MLEKSSGHMKKATIVSIIVVAVIIISAVIFYSQNSPDENKQRWITSGPVSINKAQYKLGENVFMMIHDLKPAESGDIIIKSPNGNTYKTIPFNGTLKSEFNQYFRPDTSRALKIFEIKDLVGIWKIEFQGVSYPPINFEVVNEFVPGEEKNIRSIQNTTST